MSEDDTNVPKVPTGDPGEPSQPAAPSAPPPPPPAAPAGAAPSGQSTSDNRTVMIVLAYLGILSLIPFLMEKEDQEISWHAKNGLALAIIEFGFFVLLTIVGTVVPPLGCLTAIVSPLLALGIMGLHIWLIIKSLAGERKEFPLVSDIAAKL